MMKLGLFVQGGGHHVAAWRHPSVPHDASQSFAHHAEIARLGEEGRFDMIFFADALVSFGPDDIEVWKRGCAISRIEPVTMLSAISAITKHIGLVATFSTSFIEPYYVARQFASLDKISNGRAGWNLVTSAAPSEPWNFSREKHAAPAERYARAGEFADVVLGLWDTWEDDAFIEDREAGLYFDEAKMHYLRHRGEHFQVRGPINIRRSPQGHPVIVQAGQSDAGRELAARTAEVIFGVQQQIEPARAFRADVHARAAKYGRRPDEIKIMPGVMPFVGASADEARAKFDELQSLIHPELGIRTLSELIGFDLRGYDIDGPLPEVNTTAAQEGRQRVVLDMAKRDNMSIRQVYQRVAGARAHRIIHGTPAMIADDLEEWHTTGAADGFNIMPPMFPAGLRDFNEMVVPELQRRGLFRREYEGATLRENLGLPFPVNRHAAKRDSKAAE
jgi:FMN-dependent oxidoreductase (nitrilotriacetate monooxygenase family)